jgi:hypothetical protein
VRGPILFSVLLCLVGQAGGCFHSDAHRSGYLEDGTYWSERVADRITPACIAELRGEILALGDEDEVDPAEAQLLADTAIRHAAALARRYRMVEPIEVHNTLVNFGLRKRGLCFQCAEDMYVRLRALNLRTLQLHWGVAHKDDMWLEHSGVIVTARGHPFEEGLVVDGWRHSGRLRWAHVGRDRYPWVRMFKGKFPELREEAMRGAELAAGRQRPDQRVESRAGAVREPADAAPAVTAPAAGETPGASSRGGERRGGGQLSAIATTPPKPQ